MEFEADVKDGIVDIIWALLAEVVEVPSMGRAEIGMGEMEKRGGSPRE